MTSERVCSIDGCSDPYVARGWCSKHYSRWYKWGSTHHTLQDTVEQKLESRFWEKVNVGGEGECWGWQAHTNNKGYGQFRLGGKVKLSHRVAWEMENGDIPDGICICHRCDNPPCCNPNHLFPGTHSDNMEDMYMKGRKNPTGTPIPANRGSGNGMAKLTKEQVLKIRAMAKNRIHKKEIADRFGISASYVYDILKRRRWSHV